MTFGLYAYYNAYLIPLCEREREIKERKHRRRFWLALARSAGAAGPPFDAVDRRLCLGATPVDLGILRVSGDRTPIEAARPLQTIPSQDIKSGRLRALPSCSCLSSFFFFATS